MTTTILISSAWPPTVGGASSFAQRLVGDERMHNGFEVVRHQLVKRPTIYLAEDLPKTTAPGAPLRKLASGVANFFAFLKLLWRHRPRIVQIHYNGPAKGPLVVEVALYLRLARMFGARTVVRHGSGLHLHLLPPGKFWTWFAKRVYLGAMDALIVQDGQLVPAHKEWLGDDAQRLRLIAVPNTVDTTKYAPPCGAGNRGDEFRVGCIAGPETERKGAFLLIEAVRQIVASGSIANLKVDAIAATPEFTNAVKSAGLSDYFDIRDVLDEPRKLAWFRTLDVFALPSYREGFPNVLVEAMASGLAVVASTVGAVPEVLTDGEDGMTMAPGDTSALRDALVMLAHEEDKRQALAAGARRTIETRYALDGPWIEAILGLYRELAEAA